jgi:hypothetical protein
MHKLHRLSKKNAGLVGAIFGGLLIGLPAIPISSALAVPSSVLNPCPRIFYEEPHNQRVLVPEGCPPNVVTQQQRTQEAPPGGIGGPADVAPTTAGVVLNPNPSIFSEPPYNRVGRPVAVAPVTSPGTPTTPPIQPPLPEQRSQAIARVMPMDGRVDVRLKNTTNALITYEAIGHTQRRTLQGGEEIVLRNLPTPVTVTMVRQDNGLLDVIPTSTQKGLLEVSLNESKDLDDTQGVVRIQKDGQVFLN